MAVFLKNGSRTTRKCYNHRCPGFVLTLQIENAQGEVCSIPPLNKSRASDAHRGLRATGLTSGHVTQHFTR